MSKTIRLRVNKVVEVYVADTFKERLLGYMFQKEPRYDSLLIQPCNSVHTFFMHFPIDVLFLNKENVIIDRRLGVEPGKMIMPIKEARAVLEGIAGTFEGYEIGEKLEIK